MKHERLFGWRCDTKMGYGTIVGYDSTIDQYVLDLDTGGVIFCRRLDLSMICPPATDPTGKDAKEYGAKLDGGKPLASVLEDFSLALLAVAEVGTHGAKKYSRGGWQGVNPIRYTDAKWRHLLAQRHEETDKDSGLLHAAHEAWNALAILELKLRG